MKMKKMAGALALTAALAMGTAPAFAASVDPNNVDDFSSTGSTEIKGTVKTINESTHATVPLEVVVAFNGEGGSSLITPSSDAYKITNVGTGDIMLLNAEITDVNTQAYSITPMNVQEGENQFKTYNSSKLKFESLGDGNHVCFTIGAGDVYTYLTSLHDLTAADNEGIDAQYLGTDATAWTYGEGEGIAIVANPDNDPEIDNTLPIQLGGVAFINNSLADGTTDTICKIKYTIGA